MRARSLILALVCVLAPLTAHAQTAVTGNLKDVGVANASGSNTYVRFTLIDYGAQIPRIINLAGNVVFNPIKDFKPDVNGNISGVIQGNDTISPPATKYQVCIFYQGAVFRCNTYIINGATFNLNTAVPLNTSIQAGANQLVVLSFPFTQVTPASTWTIPHNFNDPNAYVQVFSTTHQIIYPDTVNTSDPNNAVLTFVTPTAGFAIAMHAGSINIATNQPNAIISNPTGSQEIGSGQSFTFDGPVTFIQPATLSALWTFNAGISSPSIGPSGSQQHILPAVAPDVFGLLTATQTFSNKTFTAPIINGATTGNFSVAGLWNLDGVLYVDGVHFTTLAGALSACAAPGCIIYDQTPEAFTSNPFASLGASTGAQVFLGPGTWTTTVSIVIPNKSTVTGMGRGFSINTTIQAAPGFPSSTPVIQFASSLAFGIRVENLAIDCNSRTGSIGIQNFNAEEQSGVRHVLLANCPNIGLDVETAGAQNSGPYEDIEILPTTAAVTATLGVVIKGVTSFRSLRAVTFNAAGFTSNPTLAFQIDSSGTYSDIHCEQATTCISIGSQQATSGAVISNVVGNSTVTNLVTISNAFSTQNVSVSALVGNSATNLLVDQITGNTVTSTGEGGSLAFWVIGNGSTKGIVNTSANFTGRASLVTTAAASDNVAVTPMTSSGHCNLTPTNASAATNIATTFISAKTTNQITVSHTATGSMSYDISCTPN